MRLLGAITLSIVLLGSQIGSASAMQALIRPMKLGAPVMAPIGYLDFCLRRPDQCRASSGDSPAADFETAFNSSRRASEPRAVSAADEPRSGGFSAYEEANAFVVPGSFGARATDPERSTPKDWQTAQQLGLRGPIDVATTPRQGGDNAAASAQGTGVVGSQVGGVPLTQQEWTFLMSVNARINDAIRPMSDERAFGISNYWTLPLSDGPRPYGNCKHYAMEKRKALVDAGVPSSTLSLALVRTYNGELHAVLLVATDRGELVLDNLSESIKPWTEAHYRWLARQIPGHPLHWVSIPTAQS